MLCRIDKKIESNQTIDGKKGGADMRDLKIRVEEFALFDYSGVEKPIGRRFL